MIVVLTLQISYDAFRKQNRYVDVKWSREDKINRSMTKLL